MPIQTPLYPHAFVVPEAYTWTVPTTGIASLGTLYGPTLVPAAVVNPNTATQVADIPAVGHILTAIFYSSIFASPFFQAIFQVKFPAGTDTWLTVHTVNFVGSNLNMDNALSVLYLPCVPQFRMNIYNPNASPGTVEGAMTLYSL